MRAGVCECVCLYYTNNCHLLARWARAFLVETFWSDLFFSQDFERCRYFRPIWKSSDFLSLFLSLFPLFHPFLSFFFLYHAFISSRLRHSGDAMSTIIRTQYFFSQSAPSFLLPSTSLSLSLFSRSESSVRRWVSNRPFAVVSKERRRGKTGPPHVVSPIPFHSIPSSSFFLSEHHVLGRRTVYFGGRVAFAVRGLFFPVIGIAHSLLTHPRTPRKTFGNITHTHTHTRTHTHSHTHMEFHPLACIATYYCTTTTIISFSFSPFFFPEPNVSEYFLKRDPWHYCSLILLAREQQAGSLFISFSSFGTKLVCSPHHQYSTTKRTFWSQFVFSFKPKSIYWHIFPFLYAWGNALCFLSVLREISPNWSIDRHSFCSRLFDINLMRHSFVIWLSISTKKWQLYKKQYSFKQWHRPKLI